MEARQIYSCSISPLVLKIFACKWSEDNHLSFITEKGVDVFEMVPAPMQTNPIFKFSRSFIYSPETLPGEIYINDVVSEIFDWKKEDVYSFLMEDSCTPNFPKALKMIPEITDVFWSPQKLLYPHKCLLAIITSSGAVDLVVQVDRNWISIYEFTSKWVQIINEELKVDRSNPKLSAHTLKMQLNRLIATSLTWSCIYQDINNYNFAYLVIAYKNSEIVIWKIYRLINNISNIDININVELKFKKKLIDKNIRINTMLWIHIDETNYLLLIGFFNGQIGALNLQELNSEIIFQSYLTSYLDIDNIPVENLYILEQTKEWIEIIVVKGMYFITLTLDIYGKIISTKFICSPGFSITGISIINFNTILISTQDGNLHIIQKFQNRKELSCKPLKIDIFKNHTQYLGLANSQNKLLFTLITSPSIMYDHLIDRDPSCIWFFTILNITLLDPLDIIYKETSLLNCWDCLEVIKINVLKYNSLSKILSRLEVNLESLSLHKLRTAYWIMIIIENLKKNVSEKILKPSEKIEQAKSYIFLNCVSNYLSQLILQQNLTETQKLSMSLLKYHLEIWLAGEEEEQETPLSQHIKKVIETVNQFKFVQQEKCNYCDDVIIEPWATSCSNGHELLRCALTRLQITSIKFRACVICKEIFHPCLDVEIDNLKCLYCDLPVVYKNQLTNLSLQTSKKNLSKKRIIIINNKDLKDD